MTRAAKVISDDKAAWERALALYREQLRFYLDYLVPCECDHQILAKTESEVQDRYVPDEFKLRFLSRTLVRNVIEHLRECSCERARGTSPDSTEGFPTSTAAIPAQERLVYFMRDILEYCTRDTSLMIGINDTQVEKLLSFARKRIDMSEGPSSVQIQEPGWTYFRWKFRDLHLC